MNTDKTPIRERWAISGSESVLQTYLEATKRPGERLIYENPFADRELSGEGCLMRGYLFPTGETDDYLFAISSAERELIALLLAGNGTNNQTDRAYFTLTQLKRLHEVKGKKERQALNNLGRNPVNHPRRRLAEIACNMGKLGLMEFRSGGFSDRIISVIKMTRDPLCITD